MNIPYFIIFCGAALLGTAAFTILSHYGFSRGDAVDVGFSVGLGIGALVYAIILGSKSN